MLSLKCWSEEWGPAIWVLSGDGGYWAPLPALLCPAKPGSHHLVFFFIPFHFLLLFLFFLSAIFALPLCLTSVSGSHLLQTYGALVFIPGDPVFGVQPRGTLLNDLDLRGGLLSFACLGALALGQGFRFSMHREATRAALREHRLGTPSLCCPSNYSSAVSQKGAYMLV